MSHGVLLEPHGAAGWAGLMQYFKDFPADDNPDQLAVSLETAHPAKFPGRDTESCWVLNPNSACKHGRSRQAEESFDRLG